MKGILCTHQTSSCLIEYIDNQGEKNVPCYLDDYQFTYIGMRVWTLPAFHFCWPMHEMGWMERVNLKTKWKRLISRTKSHEPKGEKNQGS